MTEFISWYITLTLLGWLTFPLAYRLFPALPDRGYSLSRAAGLLVWGYVFWMLTSLGLSQNDAGGLLLGYLILVGLSIWAYQTVDGGRKTVPSTVHGPSSIYAWLRDNRRFVINVELLFLLAFAFLAFVRASNPELTSAEKPMELMFINAILRSPTFPPRDAWLSGYAISYYHFGYIMTAMLAKLTGTPGSAAHNLMTALIFALGAIGSYGILYNLLTIADRRQKTEDGESKFTVHRLPSSVAFLAPVFLLLVSNAEGFLEILHKRRLFWAENTSAFWQWVKDIDKQGLIWRPEVETFNFWTWLDIKDLREPPAPLPGGLWERFAHWWSAESINGIGNWFSEQFEPDRYLWWWRASRVVSDYDLGGGFKEIIDEFPFFSFLHADLHPHVLAIPFSLLAIAAALNLFLGGWHGELNLFGFRPRVNLIGFVFLSLLLGGLAFLNTWDILIAAALVVGAYVLARVAESGWGWGRGEDVIVFGLPLGILSVLLYLPFYVGFSSQLGGVIPNLVYPTSGAQLWVMLGTLLLPLYAYLIYLWRAEKLPGKWLRATALSLGLVFVLWGFSWLLGLAANKIAPDLGALFLQTQGVPDLGALFAQAGLKRLARTGGLLTLLAVLIPAGAFLASRKVEKLNVEGSVQSEQPSNLQPATFNLLLISLGALLVIGPEFLYLRDQFGTRINTVFKFYYQAWMLWSLAAAFGVATLIEKLRGFWSVSFRIFLYLLLLVGLTYPVFSLLNRTGGFRFEKAVPLLKTVLTGEDENTRSIARQELDSLWTIDYFDKFQRQNPDEAAAIRWLGNAPDGIVAEAIGGSYSGYARVSTYTGLPTILGWPGHESQWRGGYKEQGSRKSDVETLYATSDWTLAETIISRYDIRYIYVGGLERGEPLQEEKFQSNMRLVFQQGDVVIYEAP